VTLSLAGVRFVNAGEAGRPAATAAAALAATAKVEDVEAALAADPDSIRLLTRLGEVTVADFRTSGDVAGLRRGRVALERALRLAPDDPDANLAMGVLLLSEHRFSEALEQGRQSVELNAGSARPLGVVVDALVELGRYEEALEAVQEMVDLEPGLAAYSRVSYLRELHGDPVGAARAMRQALTSASRPADRAAVSGFLGDVLRNGGSPGPARQAYLDALSAEPGQPVAEIGLARLELRRGDLPAARQRLEKLTTSRPLPEALALLGDTLAAEGDQPGAAGQYAIVRSIEELNRAGGVVVDLELAAFEASHAALPGGDPARAVELATRAAGERPTIFASDAVAWSLHQSGRNNEALDHARAATRLGTRHASLWWHRAAIEQATGRADEARAHLRMAVEMGAEIEPVETAAAAELARELGIEWPAAG
jgi:pentatricopeptide repeat protein